MRRFTIIALLILTGLLLMACEEDGELRIRNRSDGYLNVKIDNSEPMVVNPGSGWSKYYSESTTVQIDYQGLYVFPNSINRTVSPGLPTTVNINADAGAVTIQNDHEFEVKEVYISVHGEPDWGQNLIGEPIAAGTEKTWSVSDGAWDIKIVLSDDNPRYAMNKTVELNNTNMLKVSDMQNYVDTLKQHHGVRTSRTPSPQ